MKIVPVSLRVASAYIAHHHRHHAPPRGHKWSIGVEDDAGQLRGVAVVGRPVARHADNGRTLEITRLCTDGTPNACSMLLAAAWRAARAMGHERMITYTLTREGGASLRAAGWRETAQLVGRGWSCDARPRERTYNTEPKTRWEAA